MSAGSVASVPNAMRPDGEALLAAERAALRRKNLRVHGLQLAVLVLLIGGWELASYTVADPFMISRPSQVAALLAEWLAEGYLLEHLSITLLETVVGFIAGAIAGITLGLVLALSPTASRVLGPYVNAAYALPKVALAPLFVIWFGLGIEMKYVLAAIFVLFLTFFSTWNGARQVEVALVDTLRVMGGSRFEIVRRVMIPSALTWMFNGLRISFPQALIGAVLGEIIASRQGIGFVIQNSAAQFNTDGVFAAIMILTVMAVVADGLLALAQRRAFRWSPAGDRS